MPLSVFMSPLRSINKVVIFMPEIDRRASAIGATALVAYFAAMINNLRETAILA